MRFQHETRPIRVEEHVAFAPVELFAGIVAALPPAAVVFTFWLSMIGAVGLASRLIRSRSSMIRA